MQHDSYYNDKKLGSNVGSILHACLSSGLSLIFLLGENYTFNQPLTMGDIDASKVTDNFQTFGTDKIPQRYSRTHILYYYYKVI